MLVNVFLMMFVSGRICRLGDSRCPIGGGPPGPPKHKGPGPPGGDAPPDGGGVWRYINITLNVKKQDEEDCTDLLIPNWTTTFKSMI